MAYKIDILDAMGDKQNIGDMRVSLLGSASGSLGIGAVSLETSATAGVYSNSADPKTGFFVETKPLSLVVSPVQPKISAEVKYNIYEQSYKRNDPKCAN